MWLARDRTSATTTLGETRELRCFVQKKGLGSFLSFPLRGEYMSRPGDTRPARWRDFYSRALRECGDKNLRQFLIVEAMTVCIRRQLDTAPEGASEREEIAIALNDLKILLRLFTRYR
jgi:hypothetical protein